MLNNSAKSTDEKEGYNNKPYAETNLIIDILTYSQIILYFLNCLGRKVTLQYVRRVK